MARNFSFTVGSKAYDFVYSYSYFHTGTYFNGLIDNKDGIERNIEKLYFCFIGGTVSLPNDNRVVFCLTTHDKPAIEQASLNGTGVFGKGYNSVSTDLTKEKIMQDSDPINQNIVPYQFSQGTNQYFNDYKLYLFECDVPYEFRYYSSWEEFNNDYDNLTQGNPQGGTPVYINDDGTISDSPSISMCSSFKSQAGFTLNGITLKGGAFQYSCKMSFVANWYPLLIYIKENANIITGIIKNPLTTENKGIITKKYLIQRYKVFSDETSYNNWVDDYFSNIPSGDYDTDIYEVASEYIDLETSEFSTRYLNSGHTDSIDVTADDLVIYGIDNSYYVTLFKSEIMSNQIPFKKYYFQTMDDYFNWKKGDDVFPIPFDDIDENGNPTKNDTPITPDIPTSETPELNVFKVPTTSWNSFYILDLADLTSLSQFLWNNNDTIYDSIVKGLALCGNRPLDAIISLRLYPFNMLDYADTVEQNLNIGRITVDINTVKRVTKYTPKIHIGSKFIGRYYGDFKDYSPYTSLTLYLPYYGNIELDTNTVMGKTLNIDMIFDIYTGTGTYILSLNGNIFKLIDCNIGFDIPITATDYNAVTSSIFNGIMQTSIGLGSIASGNLLGIGATTNGINSLVSAQASGGYQTSARPKSLISLMLCQYPYIIRTYTPYNEPNNYNIQYGYPYNKTNTISALKGYIEIENANLNINNATDNEITTLRELLKSGVIYK